MNRKLFSLEQFSKFVKTRAQITSEYAHALDKLSQKSLSYLYFEESGVCKAWNKLVRMEAEIARVHSSLAEVLQNQVCEQLIHLKDASEKIRKNVCCFFFHLSSSHRKRVHFTPFSFPQQIVSDGQSSMKELQDSLLSLNKMKDAYHKASRELEAAEYVLKEETAQGNPQSVAKREKKVSKCQTEVAEAETAYRHAIDETRTVQRRYYEVQLPRLLDSLQVVYFQRVQKIRECMKIYACEMSQVVTNMSPLAVEAEMSCNDLGAQQEIEEYVTKTEAFFRMPADPVFEQFIKTPEGQVPSALASQQKWANRLHLRKTGGTQQESASTGTGAAAGSGAASTTAAPTGLLGMSLEDMMRAQKARFPALRVPYVLVYLADCVIKYGGPKTEGIFRLSGSLPRIEAVKKRMNKGEYVPPCDVHDSSALFKFFLRSVPEGIVPASLYAEAIAEPATAHDVFAKLPEPNRTVAGFVIRYLRDYYLGADNVKVTQMNADNIATVFFPCFIKSPSNDLQEIMKHMDQEKLWLKKSLTGLDTSAYPTLVECLAASAPAQISVPDMKKGLKPSTETAATQRAKALPSKPQSPTPPPHAQPQPPATPTGTPAQPVSLPPLFVSGEQDLVAPSTLPPSACALKGTAGTPGAEAASPPTTPAPSEDAAAAPHGSPDRAHGGGATEVASPPASLPSLSDLDLCALSSGAASGMDAGVLASPRAPIELTLTATVATGKPASASSASAPAGEDHHAAASPEVLLPSSVSSSVMDEWEAAAAEATAAAAAAAAAIASSSEPGLHSPRTPAAPAPKADEHSNGNASPPPPATPEKKAPEEPAAPLSAAEGNGTATHP